MSLPGVNLLGPVHSKDGNLRSGRDGCVSPRVIAAARPAVEPRSETFSPEMTACFVSNEQLNTLLQGKLQPAVLADEGEDTVPH